MAVPGVGDVVLCLTMAGMAALEDALEVDNLNDAIAKVAASPSSRNMATVIHALLMGGEHDGKFSVEDVRHWKITPAAIREAISAMNVANAEEETGNAAGAPPAP